MSNINKSNFFCSFFNSEIFSEVKTNHIYFETYNREAFNDNLINAEIINIIKDNTIIDCTEGYIKTRLESAGLTKLEVQNTLDDIYSFKMGDRCDTKTINEVLRYVRNAVSKTYVELALRSHKNDPQGFIKQMKSFRYQGKADDIVPIRKFSEMNIDELAERQFKLLFKTGLKFIDDSNPLGGIMTGQLMQVVGAPATGKSLFMQFLAGKAATQKVKTLYIALGDLNELALMTRINSIMNNIPLEQSMIDQTGSYKYASSGLIDQYLHTSILPASKVDIFQLKERIMETDYELIIIDYDSNLKSITGNMYEEGDVTYAELTELTLMQSKTVVIGSQPKTAYWNSEFIDMLGANESSKKQMHLDIMLTLGKFPNQYGTPSGKMALVKDRHGKLTIANYMRSDSGRFIEVDAVTYAGYKGISTNRVLAEDEIRDLMRQQESGGSMDDPLENIAGIGNLKEAAKTYPNAN